MSPCVRPSPLALSAPDTHRFGLRVARAMLDPVDPRLLLDQIVQDAIDVAIIRVPAGASAPLARLARFGMAPIHADTLVYYQCGLDTWSPAPRRNGDLSFDVATPGDHGELAALVATTFDGYTSHYHANPRLGRDDILAGYAEWALGFVAGASPRRVTWVARRDGAIVAFACCAWDDEGTSEGVLYGVHPGHAGGGVYGDLVRYTQAAFKARGFASMKVSTQAWNLAVQKVWAREGFQLAQVLDTFHVNAMLSAGELLVDRAITFDRDRVAAYADATGDANPIHLDEEAAGRQGFDGRIAHGMLGAGELSRIFGTEVPGSGTVLLRADLVFLRPVYCDRPHRLRVRYLAPLPLSGHVPAVATLHDGSGALCTLAYCDLLKRGA